MPQGSHAPKMDYPPVKMVQFSGQAYGAGVEVMHVDLTNDQSRQALSVAFLKKNALPAVPLTPQ